MIFFRSPHAFIKKYGGNVAGFFWNAGTTLQFAFGVVAQSPREIASSLFNVASPCSYMFLGHRNWGVALGGTFGIIGTFLAVYPQIAKGEIGSMAGFLAIVVFISFGIFSPLLTRRFASAKLVMIRETFGHPRRVSGFGCLILGRMPIIYESLTHGRWHLGAVFALWGLGDLAFSFSRAKIGE